METMYTFDVTPDNEIVFTKDKEVENVPTEALKEAICKYIDADYPDSEIYARWLKNMCLEEYNNAFKS